MAPTRMIMTSELKRLRKLRRSCKSLGEDDRVVVDDDKTGTESG
jgi:hypothetical protein